MFIAMVVNIVKYVQIVINNKSKQTDRLYTYQCNDDSVSAGARVIVPFGKGNRRTEGYVFSVEEDSDVKDNIKSVIEILNDEIMLNEESIQICEWMREQYFCQYIDGIRCFIPTGASIQKYKYVQLIHNEIEFSPESIEYQIIQLLLDKKKVELKKIIQMFENGESRVKHLKKKGVVEITEVMKSKVQPVFKKYVRIKDSNQAQDYIQHKKNAPKQIKLLNTLLQKGEMSWEVLKHNYSIDLNTLKTLDSKGLIEILRIENLRIPCQEIQEEKKEYIHLTYEQKKAISSIEEYIHRAIHKTCLIHGVTGSGKTEIYMQLIQKTIQSNNQTAILLVPEISLTLQMIERFKGRFGEHIIAVLHSKLSVGERYDEWLRIKRGQVKIVIGARSSIFAPLKNIGIIILDEEHESSYKSDHTPKYDAVELAKKRAEINQAVLILGSATPTVVSYNRSEQGEYHRVELTKRYNDNLMPAIDIIDMREELKSGNKNIFSRKLYQSIKDCLNDGKQVILFLNRRGYASFISCRNCGFVMKCPKCGISLTYHANSKKAVCHYCGLEKKVPNQCPDCSSQYIKYFGVGTEQIEEIVKETFPDYSHARLDLDTTKAKGSTQKILNNFKKGKTDILIGTQIVAKGLDFPNVGLVGILAADISLNIADYRASERTFQLITQAAGRAGRGTEQGAVIVQTYKPEHYAITTACTHNYKTFYKNEIIMRKHLEYPPYSDIIQIIISGVREPETCQLSHKVSQVLLKKMGNQAKHSILGPYLAPRQKINGKFRFQILIKCKQVDQIRYRGIINSIKSTFTKLESSGYSIMIDFNPYSFM